VSPGKDLEVPRSRRGGAKDPADKWTAATAAAPAAAAPAGREEPVKKLSLEFPESVHRATKAGAALRGNTMLGEILQACRARNGLAPWPDDVVEQVRAQIAAEEAASAPVEEPKAPARPRKASPRKRAAS
jgi:hypothetical protein